MIDLRSDTVTRPSPAMMEAMARAPLGDDVLGDDPTVIELEEEAAQLLGHEAALFCPSGTMTNQIALAVHCERGDAALFDEEAHMLYYEVGAPAVIGQVLCRSIPSTDGIMAPADIERRLMQFSLHTPATTLLCVENTHNRAGGAVIPMDTLHEYRALCDRYQMRMHLDGARMFNACVALGIAPSAMAGLFDSVSICLSKGLGAPVGSLLVGQSDFIQIARRWRKRLGGGMRQSGLLAACGLVALRDQRDDLAGDHVRARALAHGIAELPGVMVDLAKQSTNFVMVDTVRPAPEWAEELKERGVACLPFGPHRLRLVVHRDLGDADIEVAIEAFRNIAS